MIVTYISNLKFEERFQAAMQLCWDILNGFVSSAHIDNRYNDLVSNYSEDEVFGYVIAQNGILKMSVSKNSPSFFILPEPENGYNYLLENLKKEEYLEFFHWLSCRDFFDSVVFVMSMEDETYFTRESLVEFCDISDERAIEILELLKKYRLVQEKNLRAGEKSTMIYLNGKKVNYSEILGVLSFTKGLLQPKYYFCELFDMRSKAYFDDLKFKKGEIKREIYATSDENI